MGWLRSVGSLKLQVSFAEYRHFYRALLQKIPLILSILLTEATSNGHVCARDFCVRFASRLIHTNTYAHTHTHQLRAVVFFNSCRKWEFCIHLFIHTPAHSKHIQTSTRTHTHQLHTADLSNPCKK